MAFATFVGAGALVETITTLTVDPHASHAAGDYELLLLETQDQAVTLTTAAGFTQHPGSPISAPSATATLATRLTVFERIWNGTDGSPVTADPGNHVIGTILSYRPPAGNSWASLSDVRSDVAGTGWQTTAETLETTTGSMDGITTSVADTLVVGVIGCAKPDVAGGTAEMSAITNANLAAITERFDDAAASGNGGWIGAWDGQNATADAIGATTWTKATASFKAMLVAEIRPGSAGGVSGAGAIASATVFGVANVLRLLKNSGALASAEAFGTHRPTRILRNTGAIASAEASGEPRLNRILRPVGLASVEVFGSHNAGFRVYPLGIVSASSVGQPTVGITLVFSAGGIASAEASGEPRLTFNVRALGVASAEAFGIARVMFLLRQAGAIASTEASGTPRVLRALNPAGIASAEAFGTSRAIFLVYPLGVVGAEAFGTSTLTTGATLITAAGGIASLEAFGLANLIRLIRQAGGIGSEEAFGTPRALDVIRPTGIASAEAVSAPRVLRLIQVVGLTSGEAFGIATLVGGTIPDFPSVYGGVLVSDSPRFDVLVVDGETYLVLTEDIPLASLNVSDSEWGAVSVSDSGSAGVLIHDRPGG